MSVLKRLFGSKANATSSDAARASALAPPSLGRPTHAEAVPGKVAVVFHAHASVEGTVGNFLTAVSKGLVANRQRELVLTLRLESGEDPSAKMKDILRFIATVHAWAREGNLVDAGGYTKFGERGLFGRSHSGLLYADARALPDIPLPERALAAIFVPAPEIRAALDYGTYRVLTRIGLQLRVFPYPIWADLERASVVTARESESLLGRVPRLPALNVFFVVTDERLRISVPRDSLNLLRGIGSLPSNTAFVLLIRPAPSANSILTWSPGQQEMSGISQDGSDGSRLSGTCLMVVPAAQRDQIRLFEDGYSLHFSSESWGLLSATLLAQQPLSLRMADDMRLELEWLPASG
jgi:hypothetical protein